MTYEPAFSALAAQIIPVILLALIVEARFMSRMLSAEAVFQRNAALRVTYAVFFALTAGTLALGFAFALEGARGVTLVGLPAEILRAALYFGVAFAAGVPTIQLAVALVGDKIAEVHRALPYSKPSRDERRKRRARAEIASLRREYEDARFLAKMRTSATYIALYQRARGVAISEAWSHPDFTFEGVDDLAAKLRTELDRLKEKLEGAESKFAASGERISDSERERFRAALIEISAT